MKDVRMKFIPGDTVYEYDTAEQGEVKGLEVLQVIMNKDTKIEYYLEGGRTRTQNQLLTERQALYLAIQYHERQSEIFRSRRAELWKTVKFQRFLVKDDEH